MERFSRLEKYEMKIIIITQYISRVGGGPGQTCSIYHETLTRARDFSASEIVLARGGGRWEIFAGRVTRERGCVSPRGPKSRWYRIQEVAEINR